MSKKINLTLVAIGVITTHLPLSTLATNGYSAHGWGTQSKSMAGIGVAMPLDNLNGANNPATLLEVGHRIDFGLSLFSPNRGYSANNNGSTGYPTVPPGNYESDSNYFLIPNFGYNIPLDQLSTIGVLIGANGPLIIQPAQPAPPLALT